MTEGAPPSPADVRDNAELSRFELPVGADVAYVTYRRLGGIVTLIHTEVPPALRNRGIGSALAKGALDLVRTQGFKIVPKCTFMISYLRNHSEYQDLLAVPLHT